MANSVSLNVIFKSYDVRGIYPAELNEETAFSIGKAFVEFLHPKTVVIGRDCRLSSDSLFTALSNGIIESGADVIDIGLCSTDTLYFAVGKFNHSGGIMITASHNPKEYNGFKFCREKAIPLSFEKGLSEIKEIIEQNKFSSSAKKGKILQKNVLKDFVENSLSFIDVEKVKPLKIVIDAGNGTAGIVFSELSKKLPCKVIPLFFEPNGNFPNHLPSPIEEENLSDLQNAVRKEKADFGMAFDGDADRVFFVDENGEMVSASLISALLAKNLLKKFPNSKILYNVPSSWIVKQTIEQNSGIPVRSRVGHAIIKNIMRNNDILFGSEHSGHYYFKQNFFADSGIIASLLVLELVSVEDKKFSQILKEFDKFFSSGEINFKVENKQKILKKLSQFYLPEFATLPSKEGKTVKVSKLSSGKIRHLAQKPLFYDQLDGLTIEFKDWWFNVRPSNTEPLLRLNLEAISKKLLEEKLKELEKIIEKS